jgi:signal transduction histidine kinase
MIKSFLSSMSTRILIIIVFGSILSAALVIMLSKYERHQLEDHMRMVHMAERIGEVVTILDAIPKASRISILNVAEKYGVKVDLTASTALIADYPETEFSRLLKKLIGENRPITVLGQNSQDCPALSLDKDSSFSQTRQCQIVFVTLKDGNHIRLYAIPHAHTPAPFQGNFVRDLILYLLGIMLIALLIAHIATKPLRTLAIAAQDLGKNIEHPPLAEHQGPTEVRKASAAFNRMQTSIRNHIQERTYMLAAIAHDLQTPLTRLRLRLEKVADKDLRASLVGDLTATLLMVKEGLDFARVSNIEEPFEAVDIDSLIEAICDDAKDAGSDVSCTGKVGKSIMASPHALRRCINNLLDNAVKYGNSVQVNVKREGSKVVISIIDSGPGIAEDQLEEVFKPFNRVESSRSRNSGGTGLGLTIARILAEKHRGSIKLHNIGSQTTGLIAILQLPLS